jgi:hypothetical protein
VLLVAKLGINQSPRAACLEIGITSLSLSKREADIAVLLRSPYKAFERTGRLAWVFTSLR